MKKCKLVTLLFLLVLGASALNGCRTAHGFGEDMEKAGEKIQDGTN
jgi:predicted small secreted protein